MAETVFSKILRGEIPAHRVYENEHVLAFLDIAPLARGHVLLIPKEAARTLDELSPEASAEIGRVLPSICRAVKEVTGCANYNVLQNNGALAHQAVMHVHFHIIPRPSEHDGLSVNWRPSNLDPKDAAALASELERRMESGK